jgi:hypothetical protein
METGGSVRASAFERMIGRRTTPTASAAASPTLSGGHYFETPSSPRGLTAAGPSPRHTGATSARSTRRGVKASSVFPSEPPVAYQYHHHHHHHHQAPPPSPPYSSLGLDDDDDDAAHDGGGAAHYGSSTARRTGANRTGGNASPRSPRRKSSFRMSRWPQHDNEDDQDDDDFELQLGTWGETGAEEMYGCDPSAVGYAIGDRSAGCRGNSSGDFDGDDTEYSFSATGRRSPGGKTRTRCRPLHGAGGPLSSCYAPSAWGAQASRRSAFQLQPTHPTPSSSFASSSQPRNKRLKKKVGQSLLSRRLVPRKGDTSDDEDDGHVYTADLVLVAPSPAVRPARAPHAVPGHFVLPLQAEVEDMTEVLLMGFELC